MTHSTVHVRLCPSKHQLLKVVVGDGRAIIIARVQGPATGHGFKKSVMAFDLAALADSDTFTCRCECNRARIVGVRDLRADMRAGRARVTVD